MSPIAIIGLIILILVIILLGWSVIQHNKNEKKRKDEIFSHKDEWGDEICNLILERRIAVDMTKRQVFLAWGKPNYVDQEEVTKKGEKVRWIFGIPRKGARYVWFTNSRVTKYKI